MLCMHPDALPNTKEPSLCISCTWGMAACMSALSGREMLEKVFIRSSRAVMVPEDTSFVEMTRDAVHSVFARTICPMDL